MSVEQIRKLRSERIALIDRYMQEIEQVKADDRISESYRQEKLKELQKSLNDVKAGHDRQINELIEVGKADCKRKIELSEFEGANEKDLMKLLLIESRNRAIEARALSEYSDSPEDLFNVIAESVENESPYAQGYINAFFQMADNDDVMLKHRVKQLEQLHKENMYNDMQRAYVRELERYAEQEAEYQSERVNEVFQEKLAKYS